MNEAKQSKISDDIVCGMNVLWQLISGGPDKIWFFCTLCKKWDGNIRNPCAVKFQSGIIGRDAPFYSV